MESEFRVSLEGRHAPLEELLQSARSANEMLSDCSLSNLIDDFAHHLSRRADWNVEHVSEYLLIFSELIRIKCRLLLPAPEPNEPEEPDPPSGPPGFLEEVATRLEERAEERARLFDANPTLPEFVEEGKTEFEEVTFFELIRSLQNILATQRDRSFPSLEITDDWNTDEQMKQILRLVGETEPLPFERILSARPTREEIIVTFLSLLQLVKLNKLRLVRRGSSSTILVVSRGENGRGS